MNAFFELHINWSDSNNIFVIVKDIIRIQLGLCKVRYDVNLCIYFLIIFNSIY